MKTNNEKKGMAPYTKFKKRPYQYSDELNNWTAAIKKGDKSSADRYDTMWKKRFAPHALHQPKRRDEFLTFGDQVYENHY